ncbi:myotubularin-related protein 11 isoform X1 [Calypte anna]|uniref:myotubularin-related protein 11 isoform X1 n=1 Tax=Calypte anna TaxID=9244 RepID=UPI0011C43C1D|nr:myotubularin-related protein 11 isoform X1 [Calypte anna]
MSRRPAFPGLPGESVLEAAQGARLRSGAGDGSVPGTLVCTNRRVLFLPRQPPGSHLFHPSTHEVALSCIQELVAVSSFTKPQVLKASTPLRFIPEELLLSCRDFRLLRFHFQQEVGAPQAFRVANAIAQAREASGWSGDNGEGPGGWCCGTEEPWEDEEEEEEGRRMKAQPPPCSLRTGGTGGGAECVGAAALEGERRSMNASIWPPVSHGTCGCPVGSWTTT